jgi:hypothetical protein
MVGALLLPDRLTAASRLLPLLASSGKTRLKKKKKKKNRGK